MYLFVIQVFFVFFPHFHRLPFPFWCFDVSMRVCVFYSCFDQFMLTFCFALSSFANLTLSSNYVDRFALSVSDHWITNASPFWCHPQPLFHIFNLLFWLCFSCIMCFAPNKRATKKKIEPNLTCIWMDRTTWGIWAIGNVCGWRW